MTEHTYHQQSDRFLASDIAKRFTATTINDAMRTAYQALRDLTDEQRGQILCWFCRGCYRYMGPGEVCHCENDE